MLIVENLNVYYGFIHAVKDLSLEVKEGEIVSLIGANGAGKTTLLQTISGLIPPQKGKILFEGKNITHKKAHLICKYGISQVPEGRRIFSNLSVLDNLELGAYTRKESAGKIAQEMERFFQRFPRMKERKHQLAGTLSGGEQQMLAIGRAMLAKPKLMILDEPSMGLAPLFVTEIFQTIQELNEEGVTILLVEQNAKKALSIADRAYVLETGSITLSGDAKDLLSNPKVKAAYLGA